MNDDQIQLFKANGDFIWHEHPNTDKLFIVLEGEMFIDFRDGQVKISKGEMFIVPRGVEHKPFTEKESHIMLVEPKRKWIDNRKKIKKGGNPFLFYLSYYFWKLIVNKI